MRPSFSAAPGVYHTAGSPSTEVPELLSRRTGEDKLLFLEADKGATRCMDGA